MISPWNFPVAIPIWKMAPALVYGNTVVIKPATETAVTCAKIIACFEEAGLPAGVINLVTGPGSVVGQGLAEHDSVNAVTFTGSNQVGKIIGQAALARGAKYQLEMGKTLPEAKGETARRIAILRYYAGEGMRKTGDVIPSTDKAALM
ncbi:aldehyde dehydrogenase family protein, partial [Clostridium tertium]